MKKRGRKVGAVSFCKVSLAELNRILKPSANVVVSLRYAEMIGLDGSKISADTATIKAVANHVAADVKVESFDEKYVAKKKDFSEDAGLKPVIQVENF
jgi:hypothetical protein